MKNFLNGVAKIKTSASLIFTAACFFYLFFSALFGGGDVPSAILWGLLLMSVAGSLIQAVCFSDWVIKKMRYTQRSLLFVLLFLPLLSFAAFKMEWFPTDKTGAWILFVGIFLLIFVVMTVGFDIYFRITGRKYDGLIGQYRKQREAQERGEDGRP